MSDFKRDEASAKAAPPKTGKGLFDADSEVKMADPMAILRAKRRQERPKRLICTCGDRFCNRGPFNKEDPRDVPR